MASFFIVQVIVLISFFGIQKNEAAAGSGNYDFQIYACGCYGGAYAGGVTSFLLAHNNGDEKYNFLSLDAGTGLDCLKAGLGVKKPLDVILNTAAYNAGGNKLTKVGFFKKEQLNGHVITHGHLDHTAGLVMASAEDKAFFLNGGKYKPIITLKGTNHAGLKEQMTEPQWPIWAVWYKFAEAEKSFQPLKNLAKFDTTASKNHWQNSNLQIAAYPLSHGPAKSTGYLICDGDTGSATSCVFFFGDTGTDLNEFKGKLRAGKGKACEHTKAWKPKCKGEYVSDFTNDEKKVLNAVKKDFIWDTGAQPLATFTTPRFSKTEWNVFKKKVKSDYPKYLGDIWDGIADFIFAGKLTTIFLECSYSNAQAEDQLFGHLTPELIVSVLEDLGRKIKYKNKKINAKTLTVVVMHIKPTWDKANENAATGDSAAWTIKTIKSEIKAAALKVKLANFLNVQFVYPKQTDIIYAKAQDVSDVVSAKSHLINNKHKYNPDNYVYPPNYYDSNYWIFSEMAVVFVGLMILFVVMSCIIGVGCGAIFGYMQQQKKIERTKQIV